MAVLNLQPTRHRRKPPHPDIYDLTHARMPDKPTHARQTHPILEDEEDAAAPAGQMQDQLNDLTRRLAVEIQTNKDAHTEMRKTFNTLHADFQKCDPKSKVLQQQMHAEIDSLVQDRVSWALKAMQVKIEGLVQAEVNDERRSRHDAQKQLHVDITDIQRELLGLSKTTNLRVDSLESTVAILHDENNERKTRKAIPWHKRYNPLRADADADALPALLAELKAAE
jgi:hypothetical protein